MARQDEAGREKEDMNMLFDVLFILYAVIYAPILVLRGKWHPGFKMRFGVIPPEVRKVLGGKENIWIHAVSLGEVVAVEEIIKKTASAFPNKQIVLTVSTKTGYSLAIRKYQGVAVVLWSPLDISIVVNIFVKAIRPVFYVAAETELWPNLFSRLDRDKIPVFVVNGRISDESYPRYRWVRALLTATLRRVRLFCMQSDLDAERIIALGAPKERVFVAGNVKFDNVQGARKADAASFGLAERKIFVAGSTHAGEEDLMLSIYMGIRSLFPDLRLVLAPRHPERSSAVAALVRKEGLTPVMMTSFKGQPLGADDVLVIDVIGCLMDLYSVASIVFVGKSLTVKGGHNIIEPAVFGKPILIGPHMQNFKDIARLFVSEGAVVQVSDALELKKMVGYLLKAPAEQARLGDLAQKVVLRNKGAADRIVQSIRRNLP